MITRGTASQSIHEFLDTFLKLMSDMKSPKYIVHWWFLNTENVRQFYRCQVPVGFILDVHCKLSRKEHSS